MQNYSKNPLPPGLNPLPPGLNPLPPGLKPSWENPLLKAEPHIRTSYTSQNQIAKSEESCFSCGNKLKSSCGCLSCHLEREERDAFPYLPKETAEELKREHRYFKNYRYDEEEFREHSAKEDKLFKEYLPEHLQDRLEEEHSHLRNRFASVSNTDEKEFIEAEELNQKLRECVLYLLVYLKRCGLKVGVLNEVNLKLTYGIAGTPYVGGTEVSSAAILYPNVGNQVFEKGRWTELKQVRIVLSKNIVQDLLQKKYVQSQTNFIFTSAVISLLHELMHAFLYYTTCPGYKIAFYDEKANESLVRAIVQVILAKVRLKETEENVQKRGTNALHQKLEEAKEDLMAKIRVAKAKSARSCLHLLLSESNDYSHPIPNRRRTSLDKNPLFQKRTPLQKISFDSEEEEFLEEETLDLEEEPEEEIGEEDTSESLEEDETLHQAVERLVNEMSTGWGMEVTVFQDIVNDPNTKFIVKTPEMDILEEKIYYLFISSCRFFFF